MEFLQPPGWVQPKGYANGVAASGRTVCVSGMIGWDAEGRFHTSDFAGQVEQVVRMTWYVIDKKEYVAAYKEIGVAYRAVFGRHFPAMTAVQVAGLIEDEAKVEIEVTAIVPEQA